MSKNYLSIAIAFLLVSQFSFSQQMPLDFSDNADVFNSWGGSSFSSQFSPTDSNNEVGQFNRSNSTSEQGNYIDLDRSIDLDFNDVITLMFYAFDPNTHTVIIKLENGTNANIELGATTSSQNTWTELTFDFSTVGGAGIYDRLAIRIDDGSSVPGAFLLDDIHDGSTPVDLNAIDVEYTDLVWADEFDSTTPEAVDGSKWHHQTFGPNGGRWYNGEEQHYTDRLDNSYVENGFLNIVAKREENYMQNNVSLDFTSARLNSKFAFTYGRVDVRAKLPFGDGTWPAIWTLGKNVSETGAYWQTQGFGTTGWPACGEIDIMEHGLGAVNHTSSALHTPSSSGNTVNVASQTLTDVANNFYVYSVNWSPNQITFLVDGVGYYTYNPTVKDASTWPFDLEQYLILNIAMGGFAGAIDSGFTQSPMVIDYVRVYQNNNLSVDDNRLEHVQVYPNPASDFINFKSNLNIDKIEVFDILGNRVLSKNNPSTSIGVSSLKTGLYFLKVFSGNLSTTKKIIIK